MEENKTKLGESLYWLDNDDILNIVGIGDTTDEMAPEYRKIVLGFLEQVKGKADWLVDLNKAGHQSSLARKAYKDMSEYEKSGKVAIFGLNPVARVIASFVMRGSRNKRLRFFKTRDEALAWLRE